MACSYFETGYDDRGGGGYGGSGGYGGRGGECSILIYSVSIMELSLLDVVYFILSSGGLFSDGGSFAFL